MNPIRVNRLSHYTLNYFVLFLLLASRAQLIRHLGPAVDVHDSLGTLAVAFTLWFGFLVWTYPLDTGREP